MNLNSIMRSTYMLGWIFAVLALVYRALQMAGVVQSLAGATSRGVLFFSGFLFLVTIATAAYAQASGETGKKTKATSA